MKPWTSAMALIVAGAMLAGSALAQTTAPSGDPKAKKDGAGATGKSDTSGMAGGSERVKAVQQALKDKGHDPGAIDGKMGPKTQSALRDFQKQEGLKTSGRLDAETTAKLGVTAPSASPSGTTRGTGSSAPGTTSGAKT